AVYGVAEPGGVTQCAAVSTARGWMTVPVQNVAWKGSATDAAAIAATHGQAPSLTSAPPTTFQERASPRPASRAAASPASSRSGAAVAVAADVSTAAAARSADAKRSR